MRCFEISASHTIVINRGFLCNRRTLHVFRFLLYHAVQAVVGISRLIAGVIQLRVALLYNPVLFVIIIALQDVYKRQPLMLPKVSLI